MLLKSNILIFDRWLWQSIEKSVPLCERQCKFVRDVYCVVTGVVTVKDLPQHGTSWRQCTMATIMSTLPRSIVPLRRTYARRMGYVHCSYFCIAREILYSNFMHVVIILKWWMLHITLGIIVTVNERLNSEDTMYAYKIVCTSVEKNCHALMQYT